jgi:hypothetical protein
MPEAPPRGPSGIFAAIEAEPRAVGSQAEPGNQCNQCKDWKIDEERPDDLPNPSIVSTQLLPDGSTITVVWSWLAEENKALLVTVYFPD